MQDPTDVTERWEAPRWLRTGLLILLGTVVLGALAMALLPDAVPVDIVTLDRGTVDVVVEEDGRTHVRDRYLLTAPVAGTVQRVEVRAGDRVHAGDVLARIDGPEAGIPDSRTMEQLRIRVGAAEARVAQARAMVEAGEAALVEAREELRRLEVLASVGGGSASALERASAQVRAREAELRSATFGVQVAESEAQDLRAALARPPAEGEPGTLELRSPVGGSVLRVHRQSAGAIAPGEALVEIGDPAELEIVVDLRSADAVRVPPGAEARITGWGGDTELEARVRRVEPSGFTRVSALGIEEQRVNVILDLEGDAQEWLRLGDGFRVEVRILLARAEDVLRVPTAALFRRGDGWAVFRVEGARTLETPITIGQRSQAEAEVLSGLEVGDRVVVYPGDRVADGVRVEER